MRGRTFRGLVKVISGSAGAQGITLAASLALARLFAPDAFGSFASVGALVIVAGTVASLRYEMAIPLPDSEPEADNVVGACISATIVTSLSLAIAIGLNGRGFARTIGIDPEVHELLWFVPPTVLLIGLYNALNMRALRKRQYSLVATRAVTQALVASAVQVTCGLLRPTATSLLFGMLVGQFVSVVLLAFGTNAVQIYRPLATWRAMRQYREYPLFLAPSALVNALGLQAPLLLGATYFGVAFAGWYGMSQRLLTLPVAVIGNSIGQVALGEFSALRRENKVDQLLPAFWRATKYLMALGVLTGCAVALLAPILFPLLLGEDYAESGAYARTMSLGLMFQMVAGPLSVVLILMGRPRWQAAWDVSRLATVVGVFVLGHGSGMTPLATLWLLSIAVASLYLLQWLLTLWSVRAIVTADADANAGRGSHKRVVPTDSSQGQS